MTGNVPPPPTDSSHHAVGYVAEAMHDGVLLARSDAAIRSDRGGAIPLLWFPKADVDEHEFAALDPELWQHGWDDWAGHVAFDSDHVELRLVDGMATDNAREVTTKRFPNRGDAAELIDVLDVRPDGELRYSSITWSDWRRPVVEGSQLLGQAIVAAARHSPGRRAVSASMVFTRPVDAGAPHALELEPITDGRSFTALGVRVVQGDRTCAAGTLLLDAMAADVVRHDEPPPTIAGPYDCEPLDLAVTGRDVRVVDDAYTGDPNVEVGPPELDAWVRFRTVPDDGPLHAALLTQFTGFMPLAAALRPHAGVGLDQAHRTLSTAVNAITISIHADIRADRWMLYHHRSTFAGAGMTHTEGRVHDSDGALLASFSVDAMVRDIPDRTTVVDSRTAL